MGDRDDRQSVSLPVPGRASFSFREPAPAATVGERGEPAGAWGVAAVRRQRRGAGASGGGGAESSGTSRSGGGPAAPLAAGRRLATLARRSRRGNPRTVRPRSPAVAAVRRTAGAADIVDPSRPYPTAPGLLPITA